MERRRGARRRPRRDRAQGHRSRRDHPRLGGIGMHILATSSASLDDIAAPVDLGQTPGDIAVLSFADSDLAGLAAAWAAERDRLPSVRLAQLRDLKHPLSVDLWIDQVGTHA